MNRFLRRQYFDDELSKIREYLKIVFPRVPEIAYSKFKSIINTENLGKKQFDVMQNEFEESN